MDETLASRDDHHHRYHQRIEGQRMKQTNEQEPRV